MTETIRHMETLYRQAAPAVEQLSAALEAYEAALPLLKELSDWYNSPQWLAAYEADEQGLLPKDLLRGVLAQDTLYDLFCQQSELLKQMKSLTKENDDAIPQG